MQRFQLSCVTREINIFQRIPRSSFSFKKKKKKERDLFSRHESFSAIFFENVRALELMKKKKKTSGFDFTKPTVEPPINAPVFRRSVQKSRNKRPKTRIESKSIHFNATLQLFQLISILLLSSINDGRNQQLCCCPAFCCNFHRARFHDRSKR